MKTNTSLSEMDFDIPEIDFDIPAIDFDIPEMDFDFPAIGTIQIIDEAEETILETFRQLSEPEKQFILETAKAMLKGSE